MASPEFEFVKVVDPNGTTANADFATIQDAINEIDAVGSGDHWTVFVNSGTYVIAQNDDLIKLADNQPRISIIGVDRDSVIIDVTAFQGTDPIAGIEIISGPDRRDMTIANLTLKVADGPGLSMLKGGSGGDIEPTGITIDNVRIETTGTNASAITGNRLREVLINDCDLRSEMLNTILLGLGAGSTGQIGPQDVIVQNCTIRSGAHGVRICRGDRVLFTGCTIVVDNSASGWNEPVGMFYDRVSGAPIPPLDPTDIAIVNSQITVNGVFDGVTAGTGDETVGVRVDTDTFPRVVDCEIVATADKNPVYGVLSGRGSELNPSVTVIGGRIVTTCGDEKETEVFDLRQRNVPVGIGVLQVSGAAFTKFSGPIQSAERRRSVVQRVLNFAEADDDAVLDDRALSGSEQAVTTGLTDPDVYRVLTVKGNQAIMDQDVYIVGTDFGGSAITDKLTLDGTNVVTGRKPFKTVTKIILPAQTALLQSVDVGTSNILGLEFPISAAADVLQTSKLNTTSNIYEVQSATLTVDDEFATVDASNIVSGSDNSIEFVALASQ